MEIIGLLAGIGYAIVTYCQWQDLRHNFELDQRAWIKISCPLPTDLNRLLSTKAEVKNFGKSIALRLDMYARMMVVKKRNTPPFDILGPILHAHASALFPSDTQELVINAPDRPGGSNVTSADFESLRNGILTSSFMVGSSTKTNSGHTGLVSVIGQPTLMGTIRRMPVSVTHPLEMGSRSQACPASNTRRIMIAILIAILLQLPSLKDSDKDQHRPKQNSGGSTEFQRPSVPNKTPSQNVCCCQQQSESGKTEVIAWFAVVLSALSAGFTAWAASASHRSARAAERMAEIAARPVIPP